MTVDVPNGSVPSSSAGPEWVPRLLRPRIDEALEDTPVLLIQGPRQCGKTTLARQVAREHGHEWRSFDDATLVGLARADPVGFCRELPPRVVLDEVQLVPELFRSIKLVVDEDRRPGRFVLTGSANVHLMPQLNESLAGRVEIIRLRPLAERERERPATQRGFLDLLFDPGLAARVPGRRFDRDDLLDRVVRGGFPPLTTRRTPARRRRWLNDYLEVLATRDIAETFGARHPEVTRSLLGLAAARTASLLNVDDVASSLAVARGTVDRYLHHLELLFLVERLAPWSTNRGHRLVKTPKLHVTDTGLCSALLGMNPSTLREEREVAGKLLETFVLQELRRQATWHEEEHRFFHYRDKDKVEVDIVVERHGRSVAGVEVTSSATVGPRDFRGLRRLAELAGERFAGGVLLYAGEHVVPLGPTLRAVPVSALWTEPAAG